MNNRKKMLVKSYFLFVACYRISVLKESTCTRHIIVLLVTSSTGFSANVQVFRHIVRVEVQRLFFNTAKCRSPSPESGTSKKKFHLRFLFQSNQLIPKVNNTKMEDMLTRKSGQLLVNVLLWITYLFVIYLPSSTFF